MDFVGLNFSLQELFVALDTPALISVVAKLTDDCFLVGDCVKDEVLA